MAIILAVDDDAHTIRVMSLWLSRHGHCVHEANNGLVALERLATTTVDIIISDMNMPKMTGMELLRRVREDLGLHVPFLMLSSRCDQVDLIRQLEPLNGHLFPKPFVPSRLVLEIDRVLGAATT